MSLKMIGKQDPTELLNQEFFMDGPYFGLTLQKINGHENVKSPKF